eukprot:COSAG04_NODE_337_length_16405_cov_652.804060_13_plen_91_part_00
MATGIDQVMTTMLKARAVCVQALSPITQRAVSLGRAEVAAAIASLLLDLVDKEETEEALAAPTYLVRPASDTPLPPLTADAVWILCLSFA